MFKYKMCFFGYFELKPDFKAEPTWTWDQSRGLSSMSVKVVLLLFNALKLQHETGSSLTEPVIYCFFSNMIPKVVRSFLY